MSKVSFVLSMTSMLQPPLDYSVSGRTYLFDQLPRCLKVWKRKYDEFEEEAEPAENNVSFIYIIVGILLFLQATIRILKQTQRRSGKLSVQITRKGKSILSGLVDSPRNKPPPAIRTGASYCFSVDDDTKSCSPSVASGLTYTSDETAEITIESVGGKKIQLRLTDDDSDSEDSTPQMLPSSLLSCEEKNEKYDDSNGLICLSAPTHYPRISPASRYDDDQLLKNVSKLSPSDHFFDSASRSPHRQNHLSNDLINLSTPSLIPESAPRSRNNLDNLSKNVFTLSVSSLFPDFSPRSRNGDKSLPPDSTPKNRRSVSLRSFLSFWSKSAEDLPVPSAHASKNLRHVRQTYIVGEGTAELEELRKIGKSLEEKGEKLYRSGRLNEARVVFLDAESVYTRVLQGTLLDMADTMHDQSLYHHDRGDTRLATVLLGAAGSIRERPTPKNILFCTRLHKQYHEFSKNHRKVRKYSKKMDSYIKIIQAQAPVMARVLRAQAKCR
eukprot:CAMPEP_0194259678 /NCGR_PEP_ID=MMETSP0158-20130606/44167_1 /TAXON_ID=33649 /ORGANISM="Thalassionema nitzschioides, Strain L26-B" /LENGTH=496 /DNA_ID=CAMNT_0038999575 /DNA_START=143 /DNA_END=1633 /DNA_ORIENTATION=+